MPTATVRIQEALGIEQCGEISVHANCTSAYKALLVAYEFIRTGRYKTALVLSSGISSSELRAEYYNQKVLRKEELFLRYFLCDGAGALVLRAAGEDEHGLFIENVMTESVGGLKPAAMLNTRPAYYMNPIDEFNGGHHHLAQMFNEQLRVHFHDEDGSVFIKGLKRLIARYDVDPSKIKFFQVNFPSKHISELIIDECAELGIKKEMLYSPMAAMGYVGPPMVFICLDKILREETLVPGNLVVSFVTEVSKFMQAGFTLECR
jgi:3-oxoacyl-[acyl-carrier-protein] synthase III